MTGNVGLKVFFLYYMLLRYAMSSLIQGCTTAAWKAMDSSPVYIISLLSHTSLTLPGLVDVFEQRIIKLCLMDCHRVPLVYLI